MIDMKVRITEEDSGYDALAANLEDMSGKKVETGIQANESEELLKYANANEFGADIDHPGGTPYIIQEDGKALFVKKGTADVAGVTKPHKIIIPPRPFIRQTFEKHLKELEKIGFDIGQLVMSGVLNTKQGLENWGDQFIALIRSEVAEGNNFEPNTAGTIRAKGGGKHPLQDSGRLMQSLKSVVT